jgi:hypothetical protein
VPYIPPTGWIERIPPVSVDRVRQERFHTRRDCPAIPASASVRVADKPYSAARCPRCAHL